MAGDAPISVLNRNNSDTVSVSDQPALSIEFIENGSAQHPYIESYVAGIYTLTSTHIGRVKVTLRLLQLDAVVVHDTKSCHIPRLPGNQRQSRLLAVQIFQFFWITGAVDSQIVAFAGLLQVGEV